jgi:MFS family permease
LDEFPGNLEVFGGAEGSDFYDGKRDHETLSLSGSVAAAMRSQLPVDDNLLEAPPRAPGLLTALRDTTFRSLKHRDYRLYFVGQIISFTGSWMQNAALMWLIFDLTRDPIWPPLLLVAQVGPTIVFGPLGGALADRFPKRNLVRVTQTVFLLNAAMLTVVVFLGCASPWLLFSLQCVNGLVQSVDLPARLAFVPDLVPKADLMNAVSLNSLLFNSARAAGPAFAGMLFVAAERSAELFPGIAPVLLGAAACFLLNTLSFAAVLWALSCIRVSGTGSAQDNPGSMLEGIRYVRARPLLGAILLLTGGLSVFGWPVISLFPAYTRVVLGLGVEHYSTLVSSLGGGALLGALLTATFGTEARRGLFFLIGSSLAATAVLALTLAPGLIFAAIAAACLGAGLILFLSTGQSVMQLSASDGARGRVMALWAMTLSASVPLGHLIAGVAAKQFSVVSVLGGMAVGSSFIVVVVVAITLLRGWIVRETA